MKYHKGCFILVLLACTAAAKPFEDKNEDKNEVAEVSGRSVEKHNGFIGRAMHSAESLLSNYISRLMFIFSGLEGIFIQSLRRMNEPEMRPMAKMLDRIMVLYMRASLEEDECVERFTCEAGDIIGGYWGTPVGGIVKLLEPMTPPYLRKILVNFRMGVKDGNVCGRMSCETEPFSFLNFIDRKLGRIEEETNEVDNYH
ncbi:uncharacterized protein LOC136040255 [Artemia franciscana]|uniref:Uncharacterized protein n=1 Tax=Artemia franciscana TaxID=6661 RepID=A0AA88HXR0_ARTSF|nr:hypothetical protein QYM36_008653 [Artemia franciscana]KAK2714151.1 hypothetical protein QYM36_008653 [Artemia franciscana]